MKRLIIGLVIIFLAMAYSLYAQHEGHLMPKEKAAAGDEKKAAKKIYQCPMHPQVVSEEPGKCPICGMDLIEVSKEPESPTQAGVVTIKESQAQLIGVKTEPVVNRALMQVVRLVAKLAFDPELYKAEQEFIQAYKTKEAVTLAQSPEINERLDALVSAASLKLKLLGLSDEQIEELKTKTESDRSLLVSDEASPYIWAYLTLYEYDLGLVKIGGHVVLKIIAYPGEEFTGKIVSIDPVLDMNSRSARARVKLDNPEGKLKPNMYGDAFIHIDLGQTLSVPREAILDTGLKKLVYIDLGKGQFKPQEVEIGPEAIAIVDSKERKFYPVIKGINENEIVVTTGAFLIDSQSQLTGGMSALWGGSMEIKEDEHKH